MDRGEVTPTLKLRRRVVLDHFADEVAGLYDGTAPDGAAGQRRRGVVGDALRADIGRRVPGVVEARDLDHVARVRRVDELAAADVDPHVAEPVEEDEVTRLEVVTRDVDADRAVLRRRVVRKRDAELGVDVHRKARAVEAPAGSRRPTRTACRGTASRSRRRRRTSPEGRRGERGRRRPVRGKSSAGPEVEVERLLPPRPRAWTPQRLETRARLPLELRLAARLGGLHPRDLVLDRRSEPLPLGELTLDRALLRRPLARRSGSAARGRRGASRRARFTSLRNRRTSCRTCASCPPTRSAMSSRSSRSSRLFAPRITSTAPPESPLM